VEVKTSILSDYQLKNPYLEKIRLLCQENSIQLILYQSPMLNRHQASLESFKMINHSALLNQKTHLFYDEIHVNKKGRKKPTEQLVRNKLRQLK
jgi:hypothetical protein